MPLAFCHVLFSGSDAFQAFWLSGIADMVVFGNRDRSSRRQWLAV
ncbi:MAG: hypothetical protein WCB27_06280 [Thermoguttaceae bacterium]